MGEARKVVTIVFSDVTGSTSLGERLDAEALRRVMERYFQEMRSILERHGGTVEKFIGDAVMAAFGIPAAHEDDALRAVRAATEMRARLMELNEELLRARGVTLAVRTGINTGEVVAGDPGGGQFYATGDAVNIAARIEQSAEPGEILLGDQTWRLVRDAVRAEPLESLSVKGKVDTVAAYRLIEVVEGAPAVGRRFDTPFVGRREELARVIDCFERVTAERAPALVTVLGSAGIGKTRLAGEFVNKVGQQAQVFQGRCLSYGEGITYWPLQEALRNLPERPFGAPDPEQATSTEETFWAYRKLFEALAQEHPLVLILEDIHWAEPTLLDLLEQMVSWTHEAPIMVLCLARPEILDERPSWPGEHIELEPLPDPDAKALAEGLAVALDVGVQTHAVAVAEGNPLFLEQMLALGAEEDGGQVSVPQTLQALLTARLDRLGDDERTVLEAAAVVGKEFWLGALLRLSPPEIEVSILLHRLVRKRLVQPTRSSFPGEDAFRFGHILIRDAAYKAIPKETRASLHERFADWLDASGTPYEEIMGHHLEQAYRLLADLGPIGERLDALRVRARDCLWNGGEGALVRGDAPAAISLLERARGLSGGDPDAAGLALPLSEALMMSGRLAQAESLLVAAIKAGRDVADRRTEWFARIEVALLRDQLHPEQWDADEARRTAKEAIALFSDLGDEGGLARAWELMSDVEFMGGRYDASRKMTERAREHARRSGDRRQEALYLGNLAGTIFFGTTSADDAIAQIEGLLEEVSDRGVEASMLVKLAGLHGMEGRFEVARSLYERSKAMRADMGQEFQVAGLSMFAEEVGLLAGEVDWAERELRAGYESLERMGEKGFRSTIAALLADALYQQGRYDEAQYFAQACLQIAGAHDVASQVWGRAVTAQLLAIQGLHDQAAEKARQAVALARKTDDLYLLGQALMRHAEVLRLAERGHDEASVLEEAAEVNERKGNLVTARKAGARLAVLQASTRG
ncbi:MAG TPA: adenylate/guanylate cyclase domain-containing protein [Gaiellaceae bacterium]|jgi:class 3 adenylate cyclase/tetratricopeptide (TPR) repeat protein